MSSEGGGPLKDATFTITGPSEAGNPISQNVNTGSDGTACLDGLPLGTYAITETVPPPGYVIDDPAPVTVTVSSGQTQSVTGTAMSSSAAAPK